MRLYNHISAADPGAPEGSRGIEIGLSVSPPAGRTLLMGRPLVRAGCINSRTPLLKGSAGERIGTKYLRP